MTDDQDDREIGDLDDEYTVLGELGRGGSAIVYRALDRALHREVAVKVVRPRPSASSEEALARLVREARTVARLQHPNIVTVHAVRRLRDGGFALVMQLIPGRTLKQAIAEDGAFDAVRAERVIKDVAEALAFAHANGVVHRDVKPENIFLDANTGRALLSDFGIAHSTEFDSRLTMDGASIGTPAYMAPEQIDGAPANARSDVYSLGLVAWEMLTGERPWEGEALYSVIFKQKSEDLPAIDARRPGAVPERLQYIIERMLQKRPSARWAGADGLLTTLNTWVVPSDWRQWEDSHRRRREAEKARPNAKVAPPARAVSAAATVRFVRPADGPAPTPAVAGASASAIPVPAASARAEPDDEAPSWAQEPSRPSRSRRLMALGGLALLLGGAGAAAYAYRAGFFAPRDDAVAGLTDSRVVEVPLVADAALDSNSAAGVLVESSRGEPIAVDSGALMSRLAELRMADSARSDSITEAAVRRAVRRARAEAALNAPAASGVVLKAPGGRAALAGSASPAGASASATTNASLSTKSATTIRATDDAGVIAAGGRHSCALLSGKVFCWGANERGQLGDGDVESREVPASIVGDLTFLQIATGLAHTCGVVRGGDAYCWGADDKGQLGDATTTSRSAPVRVSGNFSFRLLRTGLSHTCGLTVGGDVACWGSNMNGQIGDGSTKTRSSPAVLTTGARFVSLTAGWNHSCALATDGSAWCWGANDSGQLGNGSRVDARTPVQVGAGQTFTSIAAGGTHTCAVTDSGGAYCWGRNSFGQLGVGSVGDQTSPVHVETAARFISVSAGGVHSCGRTRAGQAYCWGRNVYGQLGDGTNTNRDTPTRVTGAATFTALNATGAHTCGTGTDGEMYCWGFNVEGQLGDGTRNHNARPTRVTLAGR